VFIANATFHPSIVSGMGGDMKNAKQAKIIPLLADDVNLSLDTVSERAL